MKQNRQALFEKELVNLNTQQRKAVQKTEGPVMVIAGPGTGKTQILAARIGYILKKEDIDPNNILCLTYTDAGAVAMRTRLLEFIGPVAHDIHIFTFHAFCNYVIKSNSDHFFEYSNYDLVSDLEKYQILRKMIDELPLDNPLKRLSGKVYYSLYMISSVIEDMKKENWNYGQIETAVKSYLEEIISDPKYGFIYKRKYRQYNAGDVKEAAYEKEKNKKEKILACAKLKEVYTKKLHDINRFDYQDMLTWVHDAFEKNETLLQFYQERYQYILVDEFQDTSGIQSELLSDLTGYWERPNVFVVGDDDQSIFKFQGANITNIINFNEQYQKYLDLVVLDENYRSSPQILSTAYALIDQNEERLSKQLPGLNKNLIASGDEKNNPDKPRITTFPNEIQEEIGLVLEIKKQLDAGTEAHNIAVLFRNNKDVEDIAHILRKLGIGYNQKRKVNILHEVFIQEILNLLKFIITEKNRPGQSEHIIFEILHYPFFQIRAKDIGKLTLLKRQDRNLKWMDLLGDSQLLQDIGLSDEKPFIHFHDVIYSLISASASQTLQLFFEQVLQETGLMDQLLRSKEKAWKLEMLRTLFDFLKEEHNKNPKLTIESWLEMLDLMMEENISLPIQRIFKNENGINLSTAHGSKGLQFDHVFIIKANTNHWEKKKGANNKPRYPFTLLQADQGSPDEEERRLFYVAITRAKKSLTISYSLKDKKDKDMSASRFVSEILEEAPAIVHENAKVPNDILEDMLWNYYQNAPAKDSHFIDHEIVDEVLIKFKMNPTALNKYLRCPISFYFENILRVPSARNDNMGFGNAIHYTFERYFKHFRGQKINLNEALLHQLFIKGMEKFHSHFTELEWSRRISLGNKILAPFVQKMQTKWNSFQQHETEYPISHVHLEEVPLSGNLDRISIVKNKVEVIDYKTGKADKGAVKSPTEKNPLGSDYWRQLMFYKILLEQDKSQNWEVIKGSIEFVQPDDKDLILTLDTYYPHEEVDVVRKQIVDSYTKIKNHEFEQACDKPDCRWCSFVKEYYSN